MGEVDEGLGIHGVVGVGAHELHPSALYHLVGAFLGFLAVESAQRQDIGLEVYALVLELFHACAVDVEVGVALRMGQNNLVALHLHVENHLVAAHHLLVQRELDKHILASHLEETGVVDAFLETAVDAVFASHVGHLDLHTGLDGLLLQVLEAAADVVLVVFEAGSLEVGGDDDLVVAYGFEGVEAIDALLDTLGAVVDLRHQVAVHVGAQGGEDGAGFIFAFEKAEHVVYGFSYWIVLFLLYSSYFGPQAGQTLVYALVAAVDLFDVVDAALAFGAQGGDEQRHTGADVRRGHAHSAQLVLAV